MSKLEKLECPCCGTNFSSLTSAGNIPYHNYPFGQGNGSEPRFCAASGTPFEGPLPPKSLNPGLWSIFVVHGRGYWETVELLHPSYLQRRPRFLREITLVTGMDELAIDRLFGTEPCWWTWEIISPDQAKRKLVQATDPDYFQERVKFLLSLGFFEKGNYQVLLHDRNGNQHSQLGLWLEVRDFTISVVPS